MTLFLCLIAALSQAQRRLSSRLVDFKFECIGSRQTDDELVIAGSLKEFGKLIAAIEDEKDRMVGSVFYRKLLPFGVQEPPLSRCKSDLVVQVIFPGFPQLLMNSPSKNNYMLYFYRSKQGGDRFAKNA